MAAVAAVLLAGLLLWTSPASAQEPDWDEAEATTVVSDLGAPVDIAIGPDGEIWWNDLIDANTTRYDPDTGDQEVVFDTEPVPNHVERGLVGLALDPDVASNGVFYVYYTEADPEDPEGGTNHLSRIEDGVETRLLDVPARVIHNGGRIVFDDEGRLFVSTGDNSHGYQAQELDNRLGKILHLHPDGTPANDTIEGYVYSLGHRNVYGLAYDEANDRLFATENGADERDEVNLIEAGGNYGWPYCEGFYRYDYDNADPLEQPCNQPDYRLPIGEFHHDTTAAPTGATMFQGDLYWASLNEAQIYRMEEGPRPGEWTTTVVHEADGEIYDVESHEGSLYYGQRGEIVRLDAPIDGDGGLTGDAIPSDIPSPGLLVQALVLASLAVAVAGSRRAGEPRG